MPCSSPWPYCTLPFTWPILDEIPEFLLFQIFMEKVFDFVERDY